MAWKDLFATKSLEQLHAEAQGESRLHRVLGPIGLTSLGVGAIIGAGIFVMTGRVAANDAGPAIVLSYVVAGIACALAALCYAEFASMAPVAGSAYTYAYATLGELFAWMIGWDLILEYAMAAATVAAVWSKYLNALLAVISNWLGLQGDARILVPDILSHDPFSHPGAIMNLPAVLILALCTSILVIGIRESAASNTALVVMKLAVVLFVIAVGIGYIQWSRFTDIPADARKLPKQQAIPRAAGNQAKAEAALLEAARRWARVMEQHEVDVQTVTVTSTKDESLILQQSRDASREPLNLDARADKVTSQALAVYFTRMAEQNPESAYWQNIQARHVEHLPTTEQEKAAVEAILANAQKEAVTLTKEKWGMIGHFGIDESLVKIDNATRSNFMPYGISGVMLGAALVFFAFIGFDSISTHSEEAIHPQRDVPIGILASLILCTFLYILVSAVIVGMVPYPDIDPNAAVATAFTQQAEAGNNPWLSIAGALIALGALAGMTSVLLITFLSQARIFLAMARDGLLPHSIFGVVHERFKTPHVSTILTGLAMCLVSAFTPIFLLEEMVNIGTLFAFVVVCAAVLILRIRRPDAHRPFRCPAVYVVAPAGIAVNLIMMLFLPPETWMRLLVWLLLGLCIYVAFGMRFSHLRLRAQGVGAPAPAPATDERIMPSRG